MNIATAGGSRTAKRDGDARLVRGFRASAWGKNPAAAVFSAGTRFSPLGNTGVLRADRAQNADGCGGSETMSATVREARRIEPPMIPCTPHFVKSAQQGSRIRRTCRRIRHTAHRATALRTAQNVLSTVCAPGLQSPSAFFMRSTSSWAMGVGSPLSLAKVMIWQ